MFAPREPTDARRSYCIGVRVCAPARSSRAWPRSRTLASESMSLMYEVGLGVIRLSGARAISSSTRRTGGLQFRSAQTTTASDQPQPRHTDPAPHQETPLAHTAGSGLRTPPELSPRVESSPPTLETRRREPPIGIGHHLRPTRPGATDPAASIDRVAHASWDGRRHVNR